ncbi:unnamed protein product [Anisakis simplex]|uniref:Uncharacterized protein n=1 Tax=Anisakis simplex TaxID=6269 RepID=A0A0M3KB12_ANISI|nr:unnamed protein product [Anisakis simplex]
MLQQKIMRYCHGMPSNWELPIESKFMDSMKMKALISGAPVPNPDFPVYIAVDTDVINRNSTRIDLVETFHALTSAKAVKPGDILTGFTHKNKTTPARAKAPSPRVHEFVPSEKLHGMVPGSNEQLIKSSFTGEEAKGGWQEWGAWSHCYRDERVRVRSCRHTPGNDCSGAGHVERQLCLKPNQTHTALARDPWAIEREIRHDNVDSDDYVKSDILS